MLKKLQQKWKVKGLQLVLIIATFAIGGSLCGYAGRKILLFFNINQGALWIISYILLITLLWPLSVILVSIPFGQLNFFRKYITKIFKKIIGRPNKSNLMAEAPTHIAIFASGAGSNAQNIIKYFNLKEGNINIGLIVCNNPNAGVIQIAQNNGIPVLLINKEKFFTNDGYLAELRERKINFIVLAGFLWKIPSVLIGAYPRKIVNIHPALLPEYGGKGMYGNRVHETVIAAKEKETGITIHYVDELYDHGDIIFQATCNVEENDTPDTLAKKVHALEYQYYPKVIEQIIMDNGLIDNIFIIN